MILVFQLVDCEDLNNHSTLEFLLVKLSQNKFCQKKEAPQPVFVLYFAECQKMKTGKEEGKGNRAWREVRGTGPSGRNSHIGTLPVYCSLQDKGWVANRTIVLHSCRHSESP
jgi:hypothetical protein